MPNWELIAKYLAGEATQREKEEIEQWLKADPANQLTMRGLKEAMRPGRSDEPDFSGMMEEDWVQLQQKLILKERVVAMKPEQSAGGWWLKIAASLLLLAAVGVWFVFSNSGLLQNEQQFSTAEAVKVIYLADSSRVWLNRESRLIISPDFGENSRHVKLEGEAFFEVIKNADKPFIVSAGKITTEVVGTAFNVAGETSGAAKVTVTEGKVSVSKESGKGIFLTPGEAGIYDQVSDRLVKQQNADKNFLSWKTGVIRFNAEPLGDVSLFLSKHYDTDIKLASSSLKNYSITTVLDNLDLEEALSVISITLDIKYEKKDSVIYFYN